MGSAVCCACTKKGTATVRDGDHRKRVCDQHGTHYHQQGYVVTWDE